MKLSHWVYIIQHAATTFALAYLLSAKPGVETKAVLISAGIMTLRDLKSLMDDVFGKGLGINHVEKRGPGRPKKTP